MARTCLRQTCTTGDLVVLTDPSFVGEPDLYRAGIDSLLAPDLFKAGGETFLKMLDRALGLRMMAGLLAQRNICRSEALVEV